MRKIVLVFDLTSLLGGNRYPYNNQYPYNRGSYYPGQSGFGGQYPGYYPGGGFGKKLFKLSLDFYYKDSCANF